MFSSSRSSWTVVVGIVLLFCMVDSRGAGIAGNVKLVAMNGNQYWFSSSSPYAPTLNFQLAYQYCRILGLQLAVLETTEEVETIAAYLNRDGGPLQGRYWTSGNRLGAETWIWMSSGEQLNSSFADYWLRNGVGAATPENPRHCLSMKPPISPTTKRAIFTAEECNKSLPFICEQVRCFYYNYPVTMFPDPSELRHDFDEPHNSNNATTPLEEESRTSIKISTSEKIQKSQNLIGGGGRHRQKFLADFIAEESGRIDASKIQRRMTLRPVMPFYPMPSNYDESFHQTKPDTQEAEDPEDKKKSSSSHISHVIAKLRQNQERKRQTSSFTAKILNPSHKKKPSWPSTQNSLEEDKASSVVTSKSVSVDKKTSKPSTLPSPTSTMLYHRYGTGSNPPSPGMIFGSGYISTDPSVEGEEREEEEENKGAEVGEEEEDGGQKIPKFYKGNGVRRPDMTTTPNYPDEEEEEGSWSSNPASPIIADTRTDKMGSGSRLKLRLKLGN